MNGRWHRLNWYIVKFNLSFSCHIHNDFVMNNSFHSLRKLESQHFSQYRSKFFFSFASLSLPINRFFSRRMGVFYHRYFLFLFDHFEEFVARVAIVAFVFFLQAWPLHRYLSRRISRQSQA